MPPHKVSAGRDLTTSMMLLTADRAQNRTRLVQLGGLEPPTSCSTDRRSNQLSYNCIREAHGPKRGRRTGRKLGATPRFGKADSTLDRTDFFGPFKSKSPGNWPGLGTQLNAGPGKSGGGLVVLRGAGLDRLDGVGRDLLRELAELLGLGGEGLELLAGM